MMNKISLGTILCLMMIMTTQRARADLIDDIGEVGSDTEKSTSPVHDETKDKKKATGETNGQAGKATKKEPTTPSPSHAGESQKTGKTNTDETAPPPKTEPSRKTGGAKKGIKEDRRQIPVYFSSDGNSTYTRNGILQIRDNVVVTQGDVRLQADQADVHMKPGEGSRDDKDSVDKVEMRGNVRVNKLSNVPAERINARGDRAIFENSKRRITLIGNARIHKGGKLLKGKEISYDVDSGEIKVEKAEGVIQPEDQEDKT